MNSIKAKYFNSIKAKYLISIKAKFFRISLTKHFNWIDLKIKMLTKYSFSYSNMNCFFTFLSYCIYSKSSKYWLMLWFSTDQKLKFIFLRDITIDITIFKSWISIFSMQILLSTVKLQVVIYILKHFSKKHWWSLGLTEFYSFFKFLLSTKCFLFFIFFLKIFLFCISIATSDLNGTS